MDAEIYYFSGTGNSLAVARDIAENIDGKLISIPSVMDKESIILDAEVIGIVFPVYYETYGGIPQIVKRFVCKLNNIESKYIFAVCTYGSASIVTLNFLARIIKCRGGRLAAKFTVNMPANIYPFLAIKKHQKMFDIWKKYIDVIGKYVRKRKKGKFNTANVLVGKAYLLLKLFGLPLLLLYKNTTIKQLQKGTNSSLRSYDELLPLMDRSFDVDEKCDGCQICAKVCPVNNIRMIDDKPSWKHHCEFCLACFHWCPREAISSSALKSTLKYHHAEVKLSDILKQK
ncbi:hypothetical protein ES705_24683 [subsurface metagenome]